MPRKTKQLWHSADKGRHWRQVTVTEGSPMYHRQFTMNETFTDEYDNMYRESPVVCPENPELFKHAPIGQYHCAACGCMVIAGLEHGPHDDGCALGLDRIRVGKVN